MLPAFRRMNNSVLSRLGEDAVLRGELRTPPLKINVEHNVEIATAGLHEDAIYLRSVATIPKEADPKAGDSLEHPDGFYILDSLLSDNGASMRFVLRADE